MLVGSWYHCSWRKLSHGSYQLWEYVSYERTKILHVRARHLQSYWCHPRKNRHFIISDVWLFLLLFGDSKPLLKLSQQKYLKDLVSQLAMRLSCLWLEMLNGTFTWWWHTYTSPKCDSLGFLSSSFQSITSFYRYLSHCLYQFGLPFFNFLCFSQKYVLLSIE